MSSFPLALILLFSAMLSIQFGASLAKNLFPLIGPEGTTALRVFYAAVILSALFRPWRARLSQLEVKHVVVYGVSLGLMNLMFYLSIQRLPLGMAVALEFTGPLAVAIGTSRKKIDLLWTLFAFFGVILVLPLHQDSLKLDVIGIMYALGAGVFWALYILFGKKISHSLMGGIATALGMCVAAAVVLPYGLIKSGWQIFDWTLLPLGIAMACFSSAIPYFLEMKALKALPTQTYGILLSLSPAVAALSGFIYLQEKLTMIEWIALGLIVLASAGSTFTFHLNKKQEAAVLVSLNSQNL